MRHRDVDTAVSRLLPLLAPSAVLITDDPAGALRFLGRALSQPQALHSPARALRAMARTASYPRRWSAEQVMESAPSGPAVEVDVALAESLRALPDQARADVVLHLVAGSPPDRVGVGSHRVEVAVIRLLEELAARDEQELREHEQAAVSFRRPGSGPEVAPPALALPDRLTLLAAHRPLPDAAVETLVVAVASAHRARRRRRGGLAWGAAAVAALLALSPLLPRTPVPPGAVSIYAGPTRGSLADDEDFVRAVRNSGWELAATTPGPRRVVFAGDVPGGRWALLAAGGSASRPATTAWFVGDEGAEPERMRLLSVRVAPRPAEPVSVTDPATGALAVVAAPGDEIRVSARPSIDVDGSVSRSFWDVPTRGGVAVAGLAPVPGVTGSAVRLELARNGRRLAVRPPTVVLDPGAGAIDVPTTSLRPPAPPAPGDGAVALRLRALLGQLGEPVGNTPVTAVWSGDLPGPNGRPTRLTIVAVPQPSGAVVITAPFGYIADRSGRTGSSWCGTGVLPAGLPLDQRVVAVRCDLRGLAEDAEIYRFLVVVAPPTATSVRLVDGQGAVLGEPPLRDGVAVARSPGDVARVVVGTADDVPAEAIPLMDADLGG